MKKLVSLICILVLALTLLTACDKESKRALTYTVFSSDNGYSISYPDIYSPSSLSSQMDFVIFDDESGSSFTILADEKETRLAKSDFEKRLEKDGIDTEITYFEKETINLIPCIVMEYSYAGSLVRQIVYDASDNTYTATFTELPDTGGDFVTDMETLLRALEV